jgi:hypothetical protein
LDNRYREKLKEFTENNLKDRGIGIEEAENPDDANDNLDNLKEERELEEALVNQITSLLLELGTGFSYIGKQVHIKVGESDFYIDLLFYHVKLHCYVVVELKTEKFKPEFAGQLNFYITDVNKNMKSDSDNQTIVILICRDKDNVVAEYSLENISQPIGISKYEINKLLKQEYKSSLPSIEEIEESIRELDSEK